jgi:copper chaperone CopZ
MNRKRFLATALIAMVLTLAAGLASADVIKTAVLTVPDLCGSNMADAKAAIEGLDGVDSVEFDIDNYTVTVKYADYEASPEDFKRALEALDLEVTEVVDRY